MNSLELFAGVGGLGMGVTKAGFEQKIAVEIDTKCCLSLERNIEDKLEFVKDWNLYNIAVQDVDFSIYEDSIDLLSGGPPCQPFSLGGKHNAFLDKRDMFPEAVRAVREIKPKSFIFENVKGLTRDKFSNYFEYIRLQLCYPQIEINEKELPHDHFQRLEKHHTYGVSSELSYRVVAKVLNAADFGVPQKRERVFIVGFRNDLGCCWSFPNQTHSQAALIKRKLNGEYWEKNNVSKINRLEPWLGNRWKYYDWDMVDTLPWATVREVVNKYPCPTLGDSNFFNHEYRKGARAYKGHTGSLLDEPSKTLKAGIHGVPGGENMFVNDNNSLRYFTIRECAALQSFPDEFVFYGSWSDSVRQVGNAVPVDLAYLLAKSIRCSLEISKIGKI